MKINGWRVITPRFDDHGNVSVADETGRRFSIQRQELRMAVERGTIVYSVSKCRLTVAHIDAARLM